MELDELLRRAEDLCRRCEKTASVTSTAFLTPAEQAEVQKWAAPQGDCTLLLRGGHQDCERKAAFFLPYYLDAKEFDEAAQIKVIRAVAGFGEPGHRDYLGAALGLGIRREWLGDIWIDGPAAYLFCLPSVESHLLGSLDKVGRFGVRTESVLLSAVPAPERRVQVRSFTVQSPRLDTVLSGLFHLSRTAAAELIQAGAATLNYQPCLKPDAPIRVGDVLSLRGHGKGTVAELGGSSRKGRLFVTAELLL
ncbi:MAG: YlmH/Sll1252 family protein [Oscillospiraceae bacterium]|nr:YlmH/Sll1252 family protein [Oscillospiraceae bacterium]